MKAIVGTDNCMHASRGLSRSRANSHPVFRWLHSEFVAPQVVSIDPGHDAWVMGDEPAVLIEFDFERETSDRLGVPKSHEH